MYIINFNFISEIQHINYVGYRGQTEDQNWARGDPVPAELRAQDQLPERSNHGLSPVRARIPADRSLGDRKRDQIFSRRVLQALHSTGFNRPMVGLVAFDQDEYISAVAWLILPYAT